SLFPFCFLAKLISAYTLGKSIPLLRSISRLCRLPAGMESIFLLGFLGGYPMGAQCITDAYRIGAINQNTAQRLSGICNNAGPAFIFGILGAGFVNKTVSWALLGVQILSALLVGILIPAENTDTTRLLCARPMSITSALRESVKSMAVICGWIVLFRTLIAYLDLWFLRNFSIGTQILITGMLELSNGCVQMKAILNQGQAFVISATLLSFGGLCITMQTISVMQQVGNTLYFPIKFLQGCISFILSSGLQFLLFPEEHICYVNPIALIAIMIIGICTLYFLKFKIRGRNSVYNGI
ncbi:MAG: hypothetical protein J6Q54_05515, partial [Oscillospiraceae bacterium]|nr:hypothetical protein [Oscillospiraceae bacterium]